MRESKRARQAYLDYVALGPSGSLRKLTEQYRAQAEITGRSSVPSVNLSTVEQWSREHRWQSRIKADLERAQLAAEEQLASIHRERVKAGFATPTERVNALQTLAGTIYEQLTSREDSRLWVTERRPLKFGYQETHRFNAPMVSEFRGILDDIAKELGQRQQRTVHEIRTEATRALESAGLSADPDAIEEIIRMAEDLANGRAIG